MLRFILIIFLLISISGNAQFTYVLDQESIVRDAAGQAIQLPWVGGLNSTQYNTMDLDDDGDEDLVLFDRMANTIITFINSENTFVYAPQFEALFPNELSNWILLRDFNCDGKKDIFTADVLGIKVYTNITDEGAPLQWDRFLFTTGFGSKKDILLTTGFSGKINLQLQYDDLPAIADADGDGDLDIFNMKFGGGGIEYHQNFSQERYASCDSLDFERITQSWGNVEDCECGHFAFDGAECDHHGGGRTKHAGGKALLAFDQNNDQKIDLVFSEAECTKLFLLLNEGSVETPDVNSVSEFPFSSPVDLNRFPASFFEDVDFDGKKDLLSSSNLYIKEDLTNDFEKSNWFYKNSGTNEIPEFTFVRKNFLQDQMIDVGDNSVPAFSDTDGDGDSDLFVSRNSGVDAPASIFYYKNTGTIETPEFTLTTNDYLEFTSKGFYNLKINFTDINNDNRIDLVFTATSILTGITDLHFIAGKNSGMLDFDSQPIQAIDFNLIYNENLSFTDVDSDGFVDILAGRADGKLQFWKNKGSGTSIAFSLEDDNFLSTDGATFSQNISAATADLDGDSKVDLVMGDQTGTLKIISDYKTDLNRSIQISEIVFNPLTNIYSGQNLGGRIWPVVVNLFNTNKPAIVVGNVLGGVQILRNDEGQSLPAVPVVQLYPNPADNSDIVKIKADRPIHFEILNTLGQLISSPAVLPPNEIYFAKVEFLSPGVYILKFTSNKNSLIKRLVIY